MRKARRSTKRDAPSTHSRVMETELRGDALANGEMSLDKNENEVEEGGDRDAYAAHGFRDSFGSLETDAVPLRSRKNANHAPISCTAPSLKTF